MTIAAAVGARRALGPGRLSAWASRLLGAYGAGLVAAGIFRADPSDGFPPGTPPGLGEVSWPCGRSLRPSCHSPFVRSSQGCMPITSARLRCSATPAGSVR